MSISPSAKLVPLINLGETSGKRSTIHVFPNQSIHLGRNVATQITNTELSQHVATVEWKDEKLQITVQKESSVVQIGDEKILQIQRAVILKDRDVVSLHGNDYAYQVQYCNKISVPAAAAAAATGAASLPQFDEELLEDCSCPICMELFVESTTLVPCGHVFCCACLTSIVKECPTCRQKVRCKMAIKTMDSMVWRLVSKNQFAQDEVTSYLKRSQRVLTDEERKRLLDGATSSQSPPRKRRKRRGLTPAYPNPNINAISGGNTMDDAICID